MAKKFEFRQNLLELDIAGHLFEIDAFEPSLTGRIGEHRIALGDKGEHLQKISSEGITEKELEKELEDAIRLCVNIIDDMLGEGACKTIFADRPINFLDAVDLIMFMFTEIDDFILGDVVNKYSPNRAQRRAKK